VFILVIYVLKNKGRQGDGSIDKITSHCSSIYHIV